MMKERGAAQGRPPLSVVGIAARSRDHGGVGELTGALPPQLYGARP